MCTYIIFIITINAAFWQWNIGVNIMKILNMIKNEMNKETTTEGGIIYEAVNAAIWRITSHTLWWNTQVFKLWVLSH